MPDCKSNSNVQALSPAEVSFLPLDRTDFTEKSALQSAFSYSARVQSTLKRKTSRRPDGRRLVLAEKEGFEVALQPLLRCPKKSSGFRFSSIFSTAAPTPARCIRRRRRSQALPAPFGARVQSPLKRKTSRRPDGRRLVLAEKEGFEVASQPLLRCPKKSSGFRFSSIFSTAAPTPARCIRRRRRSQALPAPFGARVQSPLKRKTSRRPDGRRLVLAEKEGFEPSRRLPDLLP